MTRDAGPSGPDGLPPRIRAYGDTTITTGTFKGKGTDKTGRPFDPLERLTDTWVKMPGGKWQCVATHGSNIKK